MPQPNYYTSKIRLLSLIVTAVFLFVVIFCRLFYIQVGWGKELQSRASEQWMRDLPLSAMRGDIFSVDGELVATGRTVFDIYARPQSVTNATETAYVLSEQLDIDYETVYAKLTKRGVSEVAVKRAVAEDTADRIREYNLNGVYMSEQSQRYYLYGDYLSQVLGFVSSDNVGQSGVEAYYDKYLRGIDGMLLTQTDLIGKELADTSMYYLPSVKGLDVVLTIDYEIQTVVENVLEKLCYQYDALSAASIVLDVTNGDILALSSKPSLDLNNLPRDDLQTLTANTKNKLLTDVYEPGSTFKIFTVSANLEEYQKGNEKAFSLDYVFKNNSRTRLVDGTKISCWTNHANGKHSNQTLQTALNTSCNPIFTDIALSLGKATLYDYLALFGFGEKSGIDYAGEQSGILIAEQLVRNADLARIGFGQSVAVTPLQLCMATAAAVNGGELLTPHIVKRIVDSQSGTVVLENVKTVKNRAISKDTSGQIARMLQEVATNGGGKAAYVEGYEVGGKTGTAQKYENGVIAQGKYVSSFIGFFPASSPKYLVLVLVDEPQGQSYGSVVAAPSAREIISGIIASKEIPPIS